MRETLPYNFLQAPPLIFKQKAVYIDIVYSIFIQLKTRKQAHACTCTAHAHGLTATLRRAVRGTRCHFIWGLGVCRKVNALWFKGWGRKAQRRARAGVPPRVASALFPCSPGLAGVEFERHKLFLVNGCPYNMQNHVCHNHATSSPSHACGQATSHQSTRNQGARHRQTGGDRWPPVSPFLLRVPRHVQTARIWSARAPAPSR
jgi:hypothetical protein